jgi:hypothetical protein
MMIRRNLLKCLFAGFIPALLRGQKVDPAIKKRAEKWMCDFDALVEEANNLQIKPAAEMLNLMRRSIRANLDTSLLDFMKLWRDQALKGIEEIPGVSAADNEAIKNALNNNQPLGCPLKQKR